SLPYRLLGNVQANTMIDIYNASDLYVTSSLQENLPNTIMESMACGVPVVAFDVGGIPEMIDHMQNGWVADFKSSHALAKGIYWCLFETDYLKIAVSAREKVVANYHERTIAQQYYDIYKNCLGIEH
ncbi:MAG: glycosyltransferase, partial [Bacteroidales bacterium]|nr:glycosyltransferase [Bacteroidales bacterium]